jgi:hypothetical protein
MNVYATVDEIKLWIGGNLSELEDDDLDPILKRYTVEASRMMDLWVSNGKRPYRRFYPTVATRYYDHPIRTSANGSPKDSSAGLLATRQPSTSILRLHNDLLELTTLTTKNGTITITSADYLLYRTRFRDDLYDQTPYNAIKLEPDGTYTVFQYINTPNQANAVDAQPLQASAVDQSRQRIYVGDRYHRRQQHLDRQARHERLDGRPARQRRHHLYLPPAL